MTDIEFRAWNKENNKMYWCIEAGIYEDDIEDDFLDIITSEKYEIMQYAGLKDCNETKIFKGDIIKYGSCKSVVEWSNIYASFCAKGMIGMDVGLWNIKFCEVIGNIYENPGLLEVTNE